jgi:hypothetical protein
MAATHTVTLYAVVIALLCFALGSLVAWSRRELRMRLLGVGLSVVTVPVVWFVFSQLPGKPDDMSAEEFREKYRCATIIPVDVRQNAPIYLLAKKKRVSEPEYLAIAWNMRLASSLQKSMRAAKINGKGTIIYGGASCRNGDGDGGEDGNGKGKKGKKGQGRTPPRAHQPGSSGQEQIPGEGFIFYPDPVPPMPEKNYGPLYEGPIEMLPHK